MASSIAGSTSEANATYRTNLFNGTTGTFDFLFPLFDNVFQKVMVPKIFYYPFIFWVIWQLMFVSIWTNSGYWSENDNGLIVNDILMVFSNYFTFFWANDNNSTALIITTIVFFVLSITSLIFITIEIFYYKKHRKFIQMLLYPIRFLGEAILPCCLMPLSISVGHSFLSLATKGHNSIQIMAVVLGLIALILNFIFIGLIDTLGSKTVTISQSPYLSFHPGAIFSLELLPVVSVLLSYFLLYFYEWTIIIPMIFHIAFNTFTVVKCFNFPFFSYISNPIVASIATTYTVNSVFAIICYFVPSIPRYIPLIIALIALIISLIVFIVVFHYLRNSIIAQLTKDPENVLKNEDDFTDYYMDLGIDMSEPKAFRYLRVGFSNCCDYFINWSLTKFIFSFNTEDAICECAHIVNFFPGETRQINRLLSLATNFRTLRFVNRFLLYQIYKVKTLRQFSSSTDSNMKIVELRNMSRQIENMSRGAWESTEISALFFEAYSKMCQQAHSIWEEALKDFPNSSKFYEEYAHYLTECECDFPTAIRMRRRGNMVEAGHTYSIDYCYMAMVRMYPNYLKKDILDLKGNVKVNIQQRRGSQTAPSTTGSAGGFDSSSEQIDDEVEEAIGKQLVTSPKTRLALHHALEYKLPQSVRCIPTATFLILFSLWVVNLAFIIYSSTIIKSQTNSMDRLQYISLTRFYMSLANLQLLVTLTFKNGIIAPYLKVAATMKDAVRHDFINFYDIPGLTKQVNQWITMATEWFQKLIDNIATYVSTDDSIYDLASEVIQKSVDLKFCEGTQPKTSLNLTLSGAVGYMLALQRSLSIKNDTEFLQYLDSYEFCELTANTPDFVSVTRVLFNKFVNYQLEHGQTMNHIFQIIMIVLTVSSIFVMFIPYIVIHYFTVKSLNLVSEIITSIDPKARQDAKEPIMIGQRSEDSKATEMKKKSIASVWMIFSIFLCSVVVLILVYFETSQIIQANNDILKLNQWDQFASQRLSLHPETLQATMMASVLNSPLVTSQVTTVQDQLDIAYDSLNRLIEANTALVQGTSTTPPCSGFDEVLDEINILDDDNNTNTDIHSIYENASLNTQMGMLRDFTLTVLKEAEDGKLGSDVPMAHMIHMSNSHIFNSNYVVSQRLSSLAKTVYSNMITTLGIIIAAAVIVTIFIITITYQYYENRAHAYRCSLSILKRCSPIALLSNKAFMTKFLHSREEFKEGKLTIAGNIIHHSTDAIICTSLGGVIDIVNPAVTELIGYTPEQLLGQPVASFFVYEDEDKITNMLNMMKNGQSSAYQEGRYVILTDAHHDVPCSVTILGMKSNNSNDIKSFVFILRDETALIQQQKQAEEAKATSENLLFQILPRDIVIKLNRGEKDISFTVPSATIMFIDIIGFSSYSASLTPQEIMGNLSYLFASFDKAISKYPSITKIKLIGDIYMCAAGLFTPDAPPETHAKAMINFALDALNELEEFNINVNAGLCVRIGVNTGGPIIAGVLGKDKPVFDIIGDPINVAARLQTTGEPNKIQIPQAVYDLICDDQFLIEKRGEVFLKGKGKTETYFVINQPQLLRQLSSQEFSDIL